MSATHTPGPWEWHGAYTLRPATAQPDRSAIHTILSPDGCFGYLGKTWREIEPEDDANRALIGAAPDLLGALQLLHKVTTAMDAEQDGDKPSEAEYQFALHLAASAIAKATT